MSISNEALDAMVAAGMSAADVVAVIKADRATDDAKIAARRHMDAARKRQSRVCPQDSSGQRGIRWNPADNAGSAGIQRTTRDPLDSSGHADMTQAVGPLAPDDTLHVVCAAHADAAAITNLHIKREVTDSLELEFEGRKEGRKEDTTGVTRARAVRRCATRLPADWRLDETDHGFALTMLAPDLIPLEADRFRDHWLQSNSPNAVKRDWRAAWRTWCRNAASGRFSGNGGNGNGKHRHGGKEPDLVTIAAGLRRAAERPAGPS